jgi:hypothetical protein
MLVTFAPKQLLTKEQLSLILATGSSYFATFNPQVRMIQICACISQLLFLHI